MKGYLYNPENGLFEGETFCEDGGLGRNDGVTAEPPPACGQGQVPVFDRCAGNWSVVPIPIVRQLLKMCPTVKENLP